MSTDPKAKLLAQALEQNRLATEALARRDAARALADAEEMDETRGPHLADAALAEAERIAALASAARLSRQAMEVPMGGGG